jgi:hypothetical protein
LVGVTAAATDSLQVRSFAMTNLLCATTNPFCPPACLLPLPSRLLLPGARGPAGAAAYHNLTRTCHNLTRTCHNLTRTGARGPAYRPTVVLLCRTNPTPEYANMLPILFSPSAGAGAQETQDW